MMPDDEFDRWRAKEFESMPRRDMDRLSDGQRLEMAASLADKEIQREFGDQLTWIYVDFLKHSNLGEAQLHITKRVAGLTAKAANTAHEASEKNLEASNQSIALAQSNNVLQGKIADLTKAVSDSSGKSSELLGEMQGLIKKWDEENERTKGKVRWLNRLTLGIAIGGFLAAIWAGCLAHKSLSLQERSLAADLESLTLQQQEAARQKAQIYLCAPSATPPTHQEARTGNPDGSGEALSTPASKPAAPPVEKPAATQAPPAIPQQAKPLPQPDAPKPDA